MAVSSTNDRVQYSADGIDDNFIYEFYILADSEIAVYLRNDEDNTSVKQTLSVDYTVNGAGTPSGGSIDMTTPPEAPLKVVLTRDPALLQESVYAIGGLFPAKTAEMSWDRVTMICQFLNEQIGRCLRFQDGDEPVGVFIPTADVRAGAILSFDENGDLTVDTQLGNNRGEWATATEYALRDIVAVSSGVYKSNVYQAIEAHTSGATFDGDIAKWGLLIDGQVIVNDAAEAAETSADAAAASAAAALISENAATSSASDSADSATASANSATASANSATEAASSATEAETLLNSITALDLQNLQGQINTIKWQLCESGAIDSIIEDWNIEVGSEDWNSLSGSRDYGTVTC